MSVSLSYQSAEPVSVDVRKQIGREVRQINKERRWWCESISFYKDRKRPEHLVGDTKLFLGLDDVISDDEGDVAGIVALDDDNFMAFHDGRFILLVLADWSKRFAVSWVTTMAGTEMARISAGRIDPPHLWQADATIDALRADDLKAAAIRSKYPKRFA
jgi:hypothetical protein